MRPALDVGAMMIGMHLDRIASPIPSDDAPDMRAIREWWTINNDVTNASTDDALMLALEDGMSVSDVVNTMILHDMSCLSLDATAHDEYTRRVTRLVVARLRDLP